MYSVVSSPEKRRASNASDVPDTIKEVTPLVQLEMVVMVFGLIVIERD